MEGGIAALFKILSIFGLAFGPPELGVTSSRLGNITHVYIIPSMLHLALQIPVHHSVLPLIYLHLGGPVIHSH
jgi:hypothetical protein